MSDSAARGDRETLVITALVVLVTLFHLAFSTGYGYFRDEFYFLDCASHLAPGYVDHAPLSILLLAIERSLFGTSLPALRLFPALAAGAEVFLAAMLARELGAGVFAQSLTAIATGFAPVLLVQTGYYSMNAYEPIFWTAASLVLIRIIRSNDQRLWLWFGLIAGLGLENKHSMLFFIVGVGAGLILTRQRRHLRSAWFWAGAAIAFTIFAPNLFWQIRHGWPTIEFLRNAGSSNYHSSLPQFLGSQITMMNPISAPLWLAGLWFYFASETGTDLRLLGWVYATMFVIFAMQGAKDYYLAPAYPILFAAGSVALEDLAITGWLWIRSVYLALLAATGLALAPAVVPILSPYQFVAYARAIGLTSVPTDRNKPALLPQHFADRFGWTEKVAAIGQVYNSLSTEERAHTALLAENYGEAGAIDFFGPKLGLPQAWSAHNSYWLWGPPPEDTQGLITIGVSRDNLEKECGSITEAAVVTCQYCMPYENEVPIFICRNLKHPMSHFWPSAKHFG